MSFDDGNYNDKESFPCDCGGNVTRNVTGQWECDSCDEKLGGEAADYES